MVLSSAEPSRCVEDESSRQEAVGQTRKSQRIAGKRAQGRAEEKDRTRESPQRIPGGGCFLDANDEMKRVKNIIYIWFSKPLILNIEISFIFGFQNP